MRDPFHLTPDEVARLTPYQVRHVYLRPQEDTPHGPVVGGGDARSAFWKACREWRSLSEDETRRLWDDQIKAQGSSP